jgi:hypothetical protein
MTNMTSDPSAGDIASQAITPDNSHDRPPASEDEHGYGTGEDAGGCEVQVFTVLARSLHEGLHRSFSRDVD